MSRLAKHAALTVRALLAAAAIGALATPALARPDVDIKLDKGKPNPDGSGNDYNIEYKVKRKDGDYPIKVTIPGGGCPAKKKGELIAEAMNKALGKNSCTENNGSISVHGDTEHSIDKVERKNDTTGEKDKIKGADMDGYAMNFRLEDNGLALLASGTHYDDNGVIAEGSTFTVGVADKFETTISVKPGESIKDVFLQAFQNLVNDNIAPPQYRAALAYDGDAMTFNGAAAGYDQSWEFVIQNTDLGLQGGENFSVEFQAAPTPASAALLGLGALVASRRRR